MPPRALRRRMIAEHSAYLSRTLRRERLAERGGRAGGLGLDGVTPANHGYRANHGEAGEPRIPRRRVKDGGFTAMLKRPEARAAVRHWWHRVLRQAEG